MDNIGSNSFAIPFFPLMRSAVSNEAQILNNPPQSSVTPCDPADPACTDPPCDPADPACTDPPCDPADPACTDPPCDPADPACTDHPPVSERECDNGADDDGDGLSDSQDPDCAPGGPCVGCVPDPPTTPGDGNGGGSDDEGTPREQSNDNGDGTEGNDDGTEGNRNEAEPPDIFGASTSLLDVFTAEAEEDSGTENEETAGETVSEDGNSTKDVVILIATGANRSSGSSESIYYSPDSITLTEATKVTWINQDPTSTHTVTIADEETGRQIHNLILPYKGDGEFVFNEGNFIYYDPSYPQLKGTINFIN
jgi:plastocyanin